MDIWANPISILIWAVFGKEIFCSSMIPKSESGSKEIGRKERKSKNKNLSNRSRRHQ